MRGGPRGFAHRSTCDVLLRILIESEKDFAHAAFTLSDLPFQVARLSIPVFTSESYNPGGVPPVWALPLSLATTYGIDFSFSSSAY